MSDNMICSNCGTSVTSNYKFCPRCGKQIYDYAGYQQSGVQQNVNQQPQQYTQYQQPQQYQPYPPTWFQNLDFTKSSDKSVSISKICETEKAILKNSNPLYAFLCGMHLFVMIGCAFIEPLVSLVCFLFLLIIIFHPIISLIELHLYKKGKYSVALVECIGKTEYDEGPTSLSFYHPNYPHKRCDVKAGWVTTSVGGKMYIIYFENVNGYKFFPFKYRCEFLGESNVELSPELQAKLKIID